MKKKAARLPRVNMSTKNDTTEQVVIIDWKDVAASKTSIQNDLLQAFGRDGTGIIAIRNVPGFVEAKQAFFPLAHTLATLPSDLLEATLTDPDSLYNAGWSHGKEKLGDQPDFAKGSFYFNPVTDLPGTEEDRKTYPLSYPKNVWPDIPEFKERATRIGCIMKDAVIALTRHLDTLAQSQKTAYPSCFLYNAMNGTEKVKARLLYYFPLESDNSQQKEDSWIGWHNDSGFLTALAGDLYVNHLTGTVVECPDPHAGLYVATRRGTFRVEIPPDCMAVQMGECTQIVSGGVFSATPHCVRGISSSIGQPIARISLPCFVDTPPSFPLCVPRGCDFQEVMDASVTSYRVPPLEKRWTKDGMTFGDFLTKTFSLYYSWNQKDKVEEDN